MEHDAGDAELRFLIAGFGNLRVKRHFSWSPDGRFCPKCGANRYPQGVHPGGGYVFLRPGIECKLNAMRHIRDKRSESNAVIYPRFRAQIGLFTNIFLDSVPPSPQEQRRSAACYYFRISRRNVMQMAGTNLARQTEPVSVETGRGNAI